MALAMPAPRAHAVCVTGSERSFGETAPNVAEGVSRLIGTPGATIAFFGVQPRGDNWALLRRALPFAAINAQNASTCAPLAAWRSANLSTHDGVIDQGRWIHCSNQGRTGNCRYNALQMLCDLAVCEAMIRRHERSAGRFDTILRLRQDVWWEMAIALPSPLPVAHVFTPNNGNAGGVADTLAVGERDAMGRYLRRVDHVPWVKAAYRQGEFKQLTTEQFLQHVLHRESVTAVGLPEWLVCMHNHRALMVSHSGVSGCVARARAGVLCRSFVYSKHENVKPWALCFNASCAELRQRGVSHVDSNGRSHASIGNRLCADSDGRQLRRACPIVSANNTAEERQRLYKLWDPREKARVRPGVLLAGDYGRADSACTARCTPPQLATLAGTCRECAPGAVECSR